MGKNGINIVVASDIRIFRESLSLALAQYEDVNVVGTASNIEEMVCLYEQNNPDILLLDSSMDCALLAIKRVAGLTCDTKVVALAISLCQKQMANFADAGAHQFVSREDSLTDLRRCIDAAVENGFWCSSKLKKILLRKLSETGIENPSEIGINSLTNRQRTILELVEYGKANKEIARTLNIETATVKNHIHQILKKLKASNRSEAVAMFRRISQSENKIVNLYEVNQI